MKNKKHNILMSDEEYYDSLIEDVDDIIDGKPPRVRPSRIKGESKARNALEYLIGGTLMIFTLPFAIVFWLLWEFIPSYGVLVMISLILTVIIQFIGDIFVPNFVNFELTWATLSGLSLVYMIWLMITDN